MLTDSLQFPFSEIDPASGPAGSLPYLPLTLMYQDYALTVSGLLDTGATVNVLPYSTGLQLGAVWERQPVTIQLTGNLAYYEARALIVAAQVGTYKPVKLVFAWTQSASIPIILGQVNFFMEFDACFSRTKKKFELKIKNAG